MEERKGKKKKGAADQITLGRYCVPGAKASDHLSSEVWVITGRNKRWIPSCPWKGGAEAEGRREGWNEGGRWRCVSGRRKVGRVGMKMDCQMDGCVLSRKY